LPRSGWRPRRPDEGGAAAWRQHHRDPADLGDYEAAMRCFDEANAIRRLTAAFDRDTHMRRVTDIHRRLSA
jgi:hypothetical protein